jgi:acyl carrier protein
VRLFAKREQAVEDAATKLEALFLDLMADEPVAVRQRTRVNCLSWDSLVQLSLVSALEEEFDITISDDDAIDLNSFEVALQILEEKVSNQ